MISSRFSVIISVVPPEILGVTFKEDCPDVRNTRVVDLIVEFESFKCNVDVYDPWVDKQVVNQAYGITPIVEPAIGKYDAIVIAVAHDKFTELTINKIREFGKENHVLFDVKYLLNADQADGRL